MPIFRVPLTLSNGHHVAPLIAAASPSEAQRRAARLDFGMVPRGRKHGSPPAVHITVAEVGKPHRELERGAHIAKSRRSA